jgi:GNAT superfamily N-acetyltransferase
MKNIEIKLFSEVEFMLPQFDLIKLLSTNISCLEYEEMLNEMIKLNYKQAVAYYNSKPVGVCGFWINTKIYSGKYVELDNVVTDENYRGQEIGKLLCNFVLTIAKQNNCKTAMLDAYLENIKAHDFYEREGFIKKGFHFIKTV